MKHVVWKQLLFCGAAVIATMYICGCSNSTQKQKNASGSGTAGQTEGMQKDEISELAFSVEKYEKKILSDRMAIAECKKQYSDDIETVKKAEYKNLVFDNCTFAELPDVKELETLALMEHGITVQESWDLIQKWLKDIGMQDEIDSKAEARIVAPELGGDGDYPLFYENMSKLDSGRGAFVSAEKCYIQIVDGIHSMSDGKIRAYTGRKIKANRDAYGDYATDVVESGTISELGDKTYELIGGKLSIAQGAQIVKDYFEAGTPFPIEEGVELELKGVNVFRVKDVYGYDYTLGRRYKSVPITDVEGGGYYDSNYYVQPDGKHAYVVDDTGVSAFLGHNEAERMVTLVSDNKMIGLADAVERLSQKLAPHLYVQMEHVGLVYVPMEFEPYYNEKIAFPCWQFEGLNKMNGYSVWVGVDVFTGDVYYKTKHPDIPIPTEES